MSDTALLVNFTATPVNGKSPLSVQFYSVVEYIYDIYAPKLDVFDITGLEIYHTTGIEYNHIYFFIDEFYSDDGFEEDRRIGIEVI